MDHLFRTMCHRVSFNISKLLALYINAVHSFECIEFVSLCKLNYVGGHCRLMVHVPINCEWMRFDWRINKIKIGSNIWVLKNNGAIYGARPYQWESTLPLVCLCVCVCVCVWDAIRLGTHTEGVYIQETCETHWMSRDLASVVAVN